ncbi:hypothetical protein ACQY0O_002200 [Thecaphora frezii]
MGSQHDPERPVMAPSTAPGPLQLHAQNYLRQIQQHGARTSRSSPGASDVNDLASRLEQATLQHDEARNKPLPALPSIATHGYSQPPPPQEVRLSFPSPVLYAPRTLPRPPQIVQDGIPGGGRPAVPGRPALPPQPSTVQGPPEPQIQSTTTAQHPKCMLPSAIAFDGATKSLFPWELVPARRQDQQGGICVTVPNKSTSASASQASRPTSFAHPPPRADGQVRSQSGPGLGPGASTPKRTPKAKSSSPAAAAVKSPVTKTGMVTDRSDRPAKGQCWGIKQDGSRCMRKVKRITAASSTLVQSSPARGKPRPKAKLPGPRPALNGRDGRSEPIVISDDSADDEPRRHRAKATSTSRASHSLDEASDEEAYCFQHVAEVNKSTGFYAASRATLPEVQIFVAFADYLGTGGHLSDHTQALLRKCMSEPPSAADQEERGYLYIYELRDRSDADRICLKVGRTVNVFRRINQWRSQCQSKDPLLRAFLPSSRAQGLLSGADAAESPGLVLSRKWERLVHLELHEVAERVDEGCPDCGSRHREIFMVPRRGIAPGPSTHPTSTAGGFELTRAIVEKWMKLIALIGSSEDVA